MNMATKDTDTRRPGHLRTLNRSSDTDFTDSRLKPEPLRLGRRDASGAELTHVSSKDTLVSPDPGALAGDEDSDLGKCERNWEAESLGSQFSHNLHGPSHRVEQHTPPRSDYNLSESQGATVHREQCGATQMDRESYCEDTRTNLTNRNGISCSVIISSRPNALAGAVPASTEMLKSVIETNSQLNMPGRSDSWLLSTDTRSSLLSLHSVYTKSLFPEPKPLTRQSSVGQLRQSIETMAETRSRPASIRIVPTQGSATPLINTPMSEKRSATRSPETPTILQAAASSTPRSMATKTKESAGTQIRPVAHSSFSDSPNAAGPGSLLSVRDLDYKLRSRLSEPALTRSGQKKPSNFGGHPGYTTPVPVTPQRPATKSSVLQSSPVHHPLRSANTASSRHSIATTDRIVMTGGASQSGGTSYKPKEVKSCPNRVADLRRLFDHGSPVGPDLGPSSRWKETSAAAAPHSTFSGSKAPVFRLPRPAGHGFPAGHLFSPVKNLSANDFGNRYGHGPGSDGISPGASPLKQKITLFENLSTPESLYHSSPSQQVKTYDGAIEDSGMQDTPHGDDSLRKKANQMLHPIGSASLLRRFSRSLRSETQDSLKDTYTIREGAGTSRIRRKIVECRLQQPQHPKLPHTLDNSGHSGTALFQANQRDKNVPDTDIDTVSYIHGVKSMRESGTSSVAKRLLARRSMPFFNKSVHTNDQPYTRPVGSTYSPSLSSGSGPAPPTPSARTTNSNSRSNASKYSFAGSSTMSAPQPRLTKLCNSASFMTENSTQSAPQPLATETVAKGRTSSLRRRFSSSLSRAINPFRPHHGKKDVDGAGWSGHSGPGASGGASRAVSVAKCDLEHPRPIRGAEMGQIIGMFERQEASVISADHINGTGQAKL
ncbi:hypothetical protein PpBr36_05446 [Pyricularia pennisetigena]|uniref:hypothetical protein n=1 Tax=Pyricularia pennisetigena TaxID=1578925 RepID=UPI00115017F6|nr:hypothetical protein PpBr36_05446 [Pyricularia pennisetigena]TLS27482.1 hypothetical protein PpBr36_05446 [Pyricularia pennisetigena]